MRWIFRQAERPLVEKLAREASISPLIARLLVARGIHDPGEAARFLSPSIDHLHSPLLMLGLEPAVARLAAAIAGHERILIYGDYDVDGTTAIVILQTAIQICGGASDFHIPHRIRDGYGMQDDVIERAAASGVRLIISVDTGIRAFSAAETARRVGVDLIVTDHHLPGAEDGVPHALAVLNPNQAGCKYPNKNLCGAAVAFKLGQALLTKIRGPQECARLLPSFLKMVAIATIADAVPLTGENRVFAKLGLEGLRHPVNSGLKALMQVADLHRASRPLNASDVAFRLAPRLNAAGRMDVAQDVIELFTSSDATRIEELAKKLNCLNGERQQEEARIVAQIYERLDADVAQNRAHCIVIDGEDWHRGVIGIAATRVVERYWRPALVIAREGDQAHGSGRSLRAFHLLKALESCSHLFDRFGGHAHAVGFALPWARVPELRAALNLYAQSRLSSDDLLPMLEVDAEIPLNEVSTKFLRELNRLEPFGHGNPEPTFVARNAKVIGSPRILKEKHVKLRLLQGGPEQERPAPGDGASNAGLIHSKALDAFWWRMAGKVENGQILAGDIIDFAFKINEDHHYEFPGVQLNICDIAKPAAQLVAKEVE